MTTLERLTKLVKDTWIEMCQYDGICPDAKFVEFSRDNPFQSKYEVRMRCLMLARKAAKERATSVPV